MRFLKTALVVLAFLGIGCAGVVVVSEHPDPPVVAKKKHPRGKKHPRAKMAANLGIPPGHLPPPGQCRIWYPGTPPGHQPRPGNCSSLARKLPAGSWLLYRSGRHPEQTQVKVCHETRPAVVVTVRLYDTDSGRFLREERP